MKNSLKLVGISALLGLSSMASAVPLSGGVSFSSIDTSLFNWDASADLFDFSPNNGRVDSVSGDFVGALSIGDSANFNDFTYGAGFVAGTIWEAGSLSFALNQIDFAVEGPNPAAPSFVGLSGLGTLTDGTDSVSGEWNITANTAGGTFSWSSSTAVDASAVPAPATFGLLGLGLAGMAAMRRRKA